MRKVYTKRYSNILGPDQNAKSSGTYKSSPKSLVLVQSAVMNDREPRASERGAFCMEGMNRFSSLQGHADGQTQVIRPCEGGIHTCACGRGAPSLPPSLPPFLPGEMGHLTHLPRSRTQASSVCPVIGVSNSMCAHSLSRLASHGAAPAAGTTFLLLPTSRGI